MKTLKILLGLSFLIGLVGLFVSSMLPTVCPVGLDGHNLAEMCDRHGLLAFCLVTVGSAIGLIYTYENNK